MNGKHHIATGIATAVIIDTGIKFMTSKLEITNIFQAYHDFIFKTPTLETDADIVISSISYLFFAALFITGCLLPDIDSKESMLGRYIHLPIEHRTWTHSIWGLIILAVASFYIPYIFWLFYGCFLHIFYDSLSRCGICWFYPFSQYKTYPTGAKIKKGHFIYLYRTNNISEKITAACIIAISIFSIGYRVYLTV